MRFNPPITQETAIRADDHIYMIMESIFEGRHFTITRDGEIVENAPLIIKDASASELIPFS